MNKTFLKFLFLTVLIFMAGCASTVRVKLLKPSEINLGNKKKLAVLNFDLSGNIDRLSYSSYYNESYNKSIITNTLIQRLLSNQHFSIVEREQLSKVISEQGLSASGFVDKNGAVKMGRLLGVDALLVGSGEYNVKDTLSRRDESKVLTDRTIYYKDVSISRAVTGTVNYRIIDTETGEIIASRNIYDTKYSTVSSFPEKGTERVNYTSKPGSIYNDPFKQTQPNSVSQNANLEFYTVEEKVSSLADWQSLADQVFDAIAYKIVYQLAPHYEEENIEVKDGDSRTMKEGLEFSKKGLWANARDSWETLINNTSAETAKDQPAAMYNLGVYYEINGNLEKSEYYFSEAYKKSGDEKYLRDKSRIEKREKEVEILKTQGRQEDLETNNSKDNTDYLEQAARFYNGGETEKAINSYNTALAKDPANDAIYYKLGLIYLEQKKTDKAITSFNKAVQTNPKNADAYNQLGKLYGEAGKIDESVDSFKKAYGLDPSLAKTAVLPASEQKQPVNNTPDHIALGLKYYSNGNYNEAIKEYNEALNINNNDPNIHNNLAIIYYMQGKFADAINHYKGAIRLNPTDASKYYNLALLYHNQGRLPEAAEQYKKACEYGFQPACDIVKQNKF